MATVPRRGKPKIMPPRKHGPEFSAQQTWVDLSRNIREIQNHNAANLSFEENHRFAYNMVLYKQGDMLYRGVKELVVENLKHLADTEIIPAYPSGTSDPAVQNIEEELLLKRLRKVWDDHRSNMFRLGQILKYMDRVHTKTANVSPTNEMGLELFLEHIMQNQIEEHVIAAILKQIRHERDHHVINRSAVKECVDVFLSLECDKHGTTVYRRDLEPVFLTESEEFYEKEGKYLVTSCDAPEFLRLVEERFNEEESRAQHYLHSQTKQPLLQILNDHLLTPHLPSVISKENSGLDIMVDNDQNGDLSRLFYLCCKVPIGLPTLKSTLKVSIVRRGKEINQAALGDDFTEPERQDNDSVPRKDKGKGRTLTKPSGIEPAVKWVQDVLDLKAKFDTLWRNSFNSDRDVESTLNEAFGTFVNLNPKCSEFISLFIDDHLKRGLKGKSEVEVDTILDKTILIFRFISEKDVFERYYKGHLAKRLLQGRSVSDDAERGMLAKLKVESGVQFTQKMEGMFHDMRISVETTKDYLEHVSKTTAPVVELNVIVMTSIAWPMTHSTSTCLLPPVMEKACKSFESFYLSRHSGRRLTWQHSLGNADVQVKFNARSHELNVATFALVILLLFQEVPDDEELAYSYIKEATAIDENELKRHLQSLACAKYKVLRKHPAGRDINPHDTFSFNADFTCPMKKIKIGTVSSKTESNEERKETRDRIDEERRHQMEACIVRIMKNRKHMTHNDLVHEVTAQLSSKFTPEPLAIKRRIEGLIEVPSAFIYELMTLLMPDRESIFERCEDRKSYNYLA